MSDTALKIDNACRFINAAHLPKNLQAGLVLRPTISLNKSLISPNVGTRFSSNSYLANTSFIIAFHSSMVRLMSAAPIADFKTLVVRIPIFQVYVMPGWGNQAVFAPAMSHAFGWIGFACHPPCACEARILCLSECALFVRFKHFTPTKQQPFSRNAKVRANG